MAIDDPSWTMIAAIGGSWSAVGTLGWWLRDQFRKSDEKAEKRMVEHEALDNAREKTALLNFGRVYVALARKGIPVVLDGQDMLDTPPEM
jgi:hypothetical protein